MSGLCMLQKSIALPDVHSGYGFAIGNVAAFDMDDPESVVSPGGVGFDINCGVRLIRTNLVRLCFPACLKPICTSLTNFWTANPWSCPDVYYEAHFSLLVAVLPHLK